MSAYSTDRSKVSYRVSVVGTVWAPADANGIIINKKSNTKTFMMTYIVLADPCEDTQLEPFSIEDMTVMTKDGSLGQTIQEVADSTSRTSGDGTGLTFCGPRVY